MNCEWKAFENKFKCKYCGFIVPRNTIKKNCTHLEEYNKKKREEKEKKDSPSLLKRAVNFGKASINHITHGMQHCTEDQKHKRFKMCQSNQCGLFRTYKDGGICAHDDCGCNIRSDGKFLDKLSWAESKCPEGYWGVEKNIIEEKNMLQPLVVLERRHICKACPKFKSNKCDESKSEGDHELHVVSNGSWCPENKWLCKWKDVDDPIDPKNDLLIITVATGKNFNELYEITGSHIRKYADRCGADFVALLNSTQNWWGLEKFRIHNYIKHYKRTLFIDADVLLFDRSPNLFEFVPVGHVSLHDDYKYLSATDWINDERIGLAKKQGENAKELSQMWNSGIVMCDREHTEMWEPPYKEFEPIHCSEQLWVEHKALEYPFWDLPTKLNCQYWIPEFYKLLPHSDIIHLSNCEHDIRMNFAKEYLK